MAEDDKWAAAGFTPAEEPKPDAAPAPQAEAPSDPGKWEAAGFKPAPSVDYSTLDIPASVTKKVESGHGILSSLSKVTDAVGPVLKSFMQMTSKPGDQLRDEYMAATRDISQSGAGNLDAGLRDFLNNNPASGVPKLAQGAFETIGAPLLAPFSVIQQEVTKTLGNEQAGVIASLVAPFPAARPLIATADGKLARLGVTADGKVDASIIGRPPVEADFKAAANQIALAGGQSETTITINGKTTRIQATPQEIEQKLVDHWTDSGLHPAEAAEIARNSPTMARDLSSATTGPVPLPERPSKPFLNHLDDQFFSLKGNHTADQEEITNAVHAWPSQLKNPETQEKLYRYGEGDPSVALTPAEGELYNKFILPWKQEATEIYERLKKIGLEAHDERVGELDPNYMHRMVKGKTPEIDKLAGESGSANPVFNSPGLMSRTASSLKDRSYFVAEDANGNRRVVQIHENGLNTVSKEKDFQPDSIFSEEPIRPGDRVKLGEDEFTIKQAYTGEIEDATNTTYYKNAAASVANNLIKLRAVERAVELSQRLRDTPEWMKYTAAGAERKPDWISPQMPLFKNDVMDPKLAHVIDDFWGQRDMDGLETAITKVNNFAVGSLFWTPFPHAFNATAWWTMARGWDWITIKGMQSLVIDGGNAIRSVVTQDEKYQELLRKGTGLVYGSVANKDFYKTILQSVGVELEKDPGKLAELARIAGLASGHDLVKAIYNASANSLWAVSDMFTVQRVMELERKGMTTEQAIAETERRLINYRKPQEILGSRSAAQAYFNPVVFEFSRYHWGVMSRYAQLAKDLIDVRDPKRSFDALGSVMMLGALQLTVWPALSAALQAASGNKDLQVPSFGPGRLANPGFAAVVNANPSAWPKYIQNYYHSDNQMMSAIAQLAPLSPAGRAAISTFTNRDTFTGKQIVEPGDMRAGNYGRVAGEAAHQAARIFVQPYDLASEIYRKGKSLSTAALEQMFGLTEHTDEDEMAKQRAEAFQNRQAARRGNKKQGLIEDAERAISP